MGIKKSRLRRLYNKAAGELARIQAFFSILYKSYSYCAKGETYTGDLLFERGLKELQGLIDDSDY